MANSFEDVLQQLVSDDEDRAALASLSSKYPGMKEGWLRQSDYSRKMDALRDSENAARQALEYAGQWKRWQDENWDVDNNVPKMELHWRTEFEKLQKERETDMKFEDIDKYIGNKGYTTKSDLEAEVNKRAGEVNDAMKGSAYFSAVLNELAGSHLHEFKTPLKTREFVSKLNEYGTSDLDVAYDKYVADKRSEMAAAKHEKDIAKLKEEVRRDVEKEYAAKTGGPPVDTEGGLGFLQAKMLHAGEADAADRAKLGDGTLSYLAAQRLREQRAGQ